MVVRGDVVLALSASGETEEILQLLATIKRLRVPLIAMTGDEICNARAARAPSPATDGGGKGSRGMRKSTAKFSLDPAEFRGKLNKKTAGGGARSTFFPLASAADVALDCSIAQ